MSSLTPRLDRLDKNYIINGNFDFWQRNTSGTTGYIADRMHVISATSTTRSTDVPDSLSQYSMQVAHSSASYCYFKQKIESVFTRELSGKTVTLSFWAKSTVGSSSLYMDINYANAVDNFSAVTTAYNTTLSSSPSSSWTQYSYTFVVTTTMATNGFEVVLVRNNTAASTTLYSQMQLKLGDSVQEFSTAGRDYSEELQLCQRYYEKGQAINGGYTDSTSLIVSGYTYYRVEKRVAATITASNLSSINWSQATIFDSPLTFNALLSSTTNGFSIRTNNPNSRAAGAAGTMGYAWYADVEL